MQLFNTLAAALALASAAVASPISNTKRAGNTIYPSVTSQYNVWTGAITRGTPRGKIFKDGHSPDITTLVTFYFPDTIPAGSMCTLEFYLDATATLTGSKLAQVFTSLAPAQSSTTSWPPGNLRDQHVGDLQFVKPGFAVELATYGGTQPFPCPIGQVLAGEFVGRYDEVDVEWDVALAGPRIVF